MGSFEKLGILVIVVIIVMILAVAIYQWGGAGGDEVGPGYTSFSGEAAAPPLTVDYISEHGERAKPDTKGATPDTWPGGIPRRHVIRKGDKVWKLVVRTWGLKESFIAAIESANPRLDIKMLQVGVVLTIPDPGPYRRAARKRGGAGKPSLARRYEVQIGDTLETIASEHLGSKARWPEIVACNQGLSPRRLMPGQEIRLPLK